MNAKTETPLTATFRVGAHAAASYQDADAIERRHLYRVTGRSAQFITLEEMLPPWRHETPRRIRKRLDRVGQSEAVWVAPAFIFPAVVAE